jgi:spore coat polysaccharide biosynthesis predicted glycosyltransferase SpsG/CTP:molybdopterin cytidylyltransferase MocA
MSATEPLLAIVPARGGSKTVPHKWARTVAGVPLLLRTLETVRASGVAERLIVSTEDKDIAAFARLRGYDVLLRPAELAADDVSISSVTQHVVETLDWAGDVAVFQPTCPLLTADTVRTLYGHWLDADFDWVISAAPSERLTWHGDKCIMPRVNRQLQNSQVLVESGAAQFMTGGAARQPNGIRRGTIPIPAAEALDIDTHADLAAAEVALGRKTVEFRVVASDEKGSGHLHRCLQLADALSHHRIRFVSSNMEAWAVDIVQRRGWPIEPYGCASADLAIVDCLDGAETFVPHYRANGVRTVLFEHDGPAAQLADLVVDEFADPKWTILRPEFVGLPARPLRDKGTRVLVTFGGTDPAGLNHRVGAMLGYGLDAEVRIAAGPAVTLDKAGMATVLRDCSMAGEMCWADVVVTGQGRTVAEAVACGTPVVSMAVNERESRHARLPGVLHLGLWAAVSDEALLRTVSRVLDRPGLRSEMVGTASGAVDGLGLDRVVHQVEGLLRGL